MNTRRRRDARGMALIVVLTIATGLLILGLSYIQNFTQKKPLNPKILEKVQSDYLATGLQKIALLKFKRFPEDFYHAFFYQVAWDNPSKRPGLLPYTPLPLKVFHDDDILQGKVASLADPLKLDYYNTTYSLLTHKKYASDSLDITINVRLAGSAAPHSYSLKVDASRVRVP